MFFLGAWRLYTTRGFRHSLRNAYAGWVLLRRVPSRLLPCLETAFAVTFALLFCRHGFATFVGSCIHSLSEDEEAEEDDEEEEEFEIASARAAV
jgi:hypothetical protein